MDFDFYGSEYRVCLKNWAFLLGCITAYLWLVKHVFRLFAIWLIFFQIDIVVSPSFRHFSFDNIAKP